MICLVGGRSRTRSPSGRRHHMAREATPTRSRRLPCRSGTEPVAVRARSRCAFGDSVAPVAIRGASRPSRGGRGAGRCARRSGSSRSTGASSRGPASSSRPPPPRSDASSYVVHQPHDLKQHVPSVHADPADAPRLAAFLDHVGGRDLGARLLEPPRGAGPRHPRGRRPPRAGRRDGGATCATHCPT